MWKEDLTTPSVWKEDLATPSMWKEDLATPSTGLRLLLYYTYQFPFVCIHQM